MHQILSAPGLAELPQGSVVVDSLGRTWIRVRNEFRPWVCSDGSGYGCTPADLLDSSSRFLRNEGPLKVVYTP
jgi:hypothetical protein